MFSHSVILCSYYNYVGKNTHFALIVFYVTICDGICGISTHIQNNHWSPDGRKNEKRRILKRKYTSKQAHFGRLCEIHFNSDFFLILFGFFGIFLASHLTLRLWLDILSDLY